MRDLDNAWLDFEIANKANQHSNPDFRQFVFNKTCPKCGSKVYWMKVKGEYICYNCQQSKPN